MKLKNFNLSLEPETFEEIEGKKQNSEIEVNIPEDDIHLEDRRINLRVGLKQTHGNSLFNFIKFLQ